MAIKTWKCVVCGEEFRSKHKKPHCDQEPAELLTAPQVNFFEKTDKNTGKSALVNQEKILKERARAHSRDHDLHDLIQLNPKDDATKNHWINENGTVRRKIDDK